MNFSSLKKKAKEDNNSLPLTKEECALFLGLISESSIKIKDIQYVYDLLFKVQEFVQKEK
tara:strand:+ start:1026 stop:1205 length:180 start_codon:yes stop_codon:yes gene_type:complete